VGDTLTIAFTSVVSKTAMGYYPAAVDAAGLKVRVTFHALRHYFAVRCLARGIPISVVSDYLGHTSIELTVKLYGRFGDDARARRKWIELLDEPVDAIATRRMLGDAASVGTTPIRPSSRWGAPTARTPSATRTARDSPIADTASDPLQTTSCSLNLTWPRTRVAPKWPQTQNAGLARSANPA
jgi:hypothetical protein